ncbi:ArsR/SmtB family transcription factor [Streptomyces xiamenensis]
MEAQQPGDSSTSPATSIDTLRVMAHPGRIRLYELLVHHGRSRVSDLASRSGLAVGSVSYHLSQLHRAGLVRESADAGADKRQHWWEAVPGGFHWSPGDFLSSPAERKVSALALQVFNERRIQYLMHWQETWDQWPRPWIDAAVQTDAVLNLTPEEMQAMESELNALVRRWAEHAAASPDQAGRRRVFTMTHAFPLPDDNPEHS